MINEIRMAATPAVNAAPADARAPGAGEFDDVLRQALPGEPQAPRTPADQARADDPAAQEKTGRAPGGDTRVAADGAGTASDAAEPEGKGTSTLPDDASAGARATRGRAATPSRVPRATPPARPATPPAQAADAGQSDTARTILLDAARGAALAGARAAGAEPREGTVVGDTGTGDGTGDGTGEPHESAGANTAPATPALPIAPALPGVTALPAVAVAPATANVAGDAATAGAGLDPDGAARRGTGAARRALPDAITVTPAGDDRAAGSGDATSAAPVATTVPDARFAAREGAPASVASKTGDDKAARAADGQRAHADTPPPDAALALAPAPGANVAAASFAPAGRRAEPTLESALAALPRALSARGPRDAGGPDNAEGASGGFAGMLASAAWSTPAKAAGGADTVPQFPIGTPPSDPQFPGVLSEQVATIALAGLDRAEIQLSPRDLGPIRIELSLSGESASIAFSAALPETRQAIEQSLPTLHTMLADHGIELSQASVGQGRDGGGGGAASYAAGADSRSASRSTVDPGASAASSIAVEPRRSRGLLDLFA